MLAPATDSSPILCLYCGEWFSLPISIVVSPPVGCCSDDLCRYTASAWEEEKHETAGNAVYGRVVWGGDWPGGSST